MVVEVTSLLFAKDVLLAPLKEDQWKFLGHLAKCAVAGIKLCFFKSESIVFSLKKVWCSVQVRGETLPLVKFKGIEILFTGHGTRLCEIDKQTEPAAAVWHSLYRSMLVKQDLSWWTKLGAEPLLLQIEYRQLRCCGHTARISIVWHLLERYQTHPSEWRPKGKPGPCWSGGICVPHLKEVLKIGSAVI